MLSLVTIKACNPVVDAGEDTDWLAEYQLTLRQVLSQATQSNQQMEVTGMDQLAANIRQAYIDVLGSQADMEAFENGYRMVANREIRAKETDTDAGSVVQDIIRESDTPEQALELLDELLAGSDLDDIGRLEAINVREFLVFLTDNNELITRLRASNALAKRLGRTLSGETTCQVEELEFDEESNTYVVVIVVTTECDGNQGGGDETCDDGWFNCWGRCAFGIAGGVLTGAGGGCVTGGTFGFVTGLFGAAGGCIGGAVIGGVGAGLSGAAEFC